MLCACVLGRCECRSVCKKPWTSSLPRQVLTEPGLISPLFLFSVYLHLDALLLSACTIVRFNFKYPVVSSLRMYDDDTYGSAATAKQLYEFVNIVRNVQVRAHTHVHIVC